MMLNMVQIILNNGWIIEDEKLLDQILQTSKIEACQLNYVEWLRKREGELPETLLYQLQSAFLLCENLGFTDFIYLEKVHQPKLEAIANSERIEKQLMDKQQESRAHGFQVLKFAEQQKL